MKSPSTNSAPAWLFSFVDLAFLLLIAMTQMSADEMPELGEIVIPRIHATSADEKTAAGLEFVRELIEKEGWVTDEDLGRVRDAGYGEAEITEIVANVALTMFTNYFNHVADTEIDFPVARPLAAV